MRQIKFRAWDKEKMQIYPVTALYDDGTCRVQDDARNLPIHYSKCIIMQFTGLYDKNGKEVYEGDVVKILYTDWISQDSFDIGEVVFEDAEYSISIYDKKYQEKYLNSIHPGKYGWIEVIGNIYEHQHLLEQQS